MSVTRCDFVGCLGFEMTPGSVVAGAENQINIMFLARFDFFTYFVNGLMSNRLVHVFSSVGF